jgi:hypothetical protein
VNPDETLYYLCSQLKSMRAFLILGLVAFFTSCSVKPEHDQANQRKIDSLESTIHSLRPGLGEYMLSVQMHHNKLWYAGAARNWDLASFEIDEIREQIEHASVNCSDRPEIRTLPMLQPFIDSLDVVVKAKDSQKFQARFTAMTQVCNECHRMVHFEFIHIKIPDQPMFSNQEW